MALKERKKSWIISPLDLQTDSWYQFKANDILWKKKYAFFFFFKLQSIPYLAICKPSRPDLSMNRCTVSVRCPLDQDFVNSLVIFTHLLFLSSVLFRKYLPNVLKLHLLTFVFLKMKIQFMLHLYTLDVVYLSNECNSWLRVNQLSSMSRAQKETWKGNFSPICLHLLFKSPLSRSLHNKTESKFSPRPRANTFSFI